MKWYLEWYNLVFILGLVAILFYAFITATGIIGGDGDAEADGDGDGGGGDTDHDIGHDHEGHWGLWSFRGAMGVGKAPLASVIIAFLALWAIAGLVVNHWNKVKLLENQNWALLSIAIALVVSLAGTSVVARVLGRWMPVLEDYSCKSADLIGLSAQVTYEVDEKSGAVMLRDPLGRLIEVQARVKAGTGPFKAGEAVKLVSELGTNTFVVEALN